MSKKNDPKAEIAENAQPIGQEVAPAARALRPEDLYGKPLSLNYKRSHFIETPSRSIVISHERPTFVPQKGKISKVDLDCLFKNLITGRLVRSETPSPEFDKNPDALQRHMDFLKLRVPVAEVKTYIGNIINGPQMDGGYSKLEILETMLGVEEINPITRAGGQNRTEVVKELRDAINHVIEYYGGVSKITSEVSTVPAIPSGDSAPSRSPTPGPRANPASILALK